GISATRGIALAAGKPAVGLSTLAGFAAPLIADDDSTQVVAAIDARHEQVYLQIFGTGGGPPFAPPNPGRRAPPRAAAAPTRPRPILRPAPKGGAGRRPGGAGPRWRGGRAARHDFGGAGPAAPPGGGGPPPPNPPLSARPRRPPKSPRPPPPPMIGI